MTASVRAGSDWIAHVGVVGIVSMAGIHRLAMKCGEVLMRPDVRAMIADFRRATILIGLADLPLEMPRLPGRCAHMPACIVCSVVDEPLFVSHAWHQASKHGYTRAVFTDPSEAQVWAVDRLAGTSALDQFRE